MESVKGGSETTTTTRRKKKKKKANEPRKEWKKDETGKTGLRQQWREFKLEHDDDWQELWRIGRKCFVDTVRTIFFLVFFFCCFILST